MRKPNHLHIKFITGRVQEELWINYEDIESIFLLGTKLDSSSQSQNIVDMYHNLHQQINDKLSTLVKRVDYINNL